MNSRILTFGALSGMLVAAGCGGGSGAGSPNLSSALPTIGGPTVATQGKGSFVTSFRLPYSTARAAAGSNRSPQYLSPGTSGLTMMLGNGTTTSTAAVTSGGTLGAAGGFSNPAAGTATLATGTGTYAVGDTITVAGITTAVNSTTSDVFTVTSILGANVTGTWAATGFGTAANNGTVAITTVPNIAQTAVIGTISAPLALQPGTTTKSIPLSVNGATATSSVTYSFAPASTAGYYTFTATFSGFTPGTAEKLGVVTTDITHNNFVLAEGQTAVAFTIPAGGQSIVPTLTLQPVVANVFVPTPTVVPALTLGAVAGTFETTVFATDELGYVIPDSTGTIDNLPGTPAITISATTPTNLTFKKYGPPYTSAATSATSLTTLPAGGASAATAVAGVLSIGPTGDYTASVQGTLLQNIVTPGAPFSLSTNGATVPAATNSAGNPLNITCATSSSSVAWNAVLTSTAPPATVTGYTLTAGTNYPAASTTISLTPINCSPGFTVPIQ